MDWFMNDHKGSSTRGQCDPRKQQIQTIPALHSNHDVSHFVTPFTQILGLCQKNNRMVRGYLNNNVRQ